MDSGRRSGHGRVVYLYYELCAKIWGGSPATEQIGTGVETVDLIDFTPVSNDTSAGQDMGMDKYQIKENEQCAASSDSHFSDQQLRPIFRSAASQ